MRLMTILIVTLLAAACSDDGGTSSGGPGPAGTYRGELRSAVASTAGPLALVNDIEIIINPDRTLRVNIESTSSNPGDTFTCASTRTGSPVTLNINNFFEGVAAGVCSGTISGTFVQCNTNAAINGQVQGNAIVGEYGERDQCNIGSLVAQGNYSAFRI